MLTHIKRWLEPPHFEGDEDKARTASILNTLMVGTIVTLALAGLAAPFMFVEKVYNFVFILAFFLLLLVIWWLMQHGRVRLASGLFASGLWIIFTIFLSLAGGMSSIAAVFYLAGTVVAGLLLGERAALIQAAACSLAGLAMVTTEASGYPLPRIFPVPAGVGWLGLTFGLLLTVTALNLTLRGLNDALARARRNECALAEINRHLQAEIVERKCAEEALQVSEERYRLLVENANEIIQVNPRMGDLMGSSREELLTMHVADLQAPEVRQSNNVIPNEMALYGNNLFESLNLHRDGRRIPVEVSVVRMASHQGDLYVSVVRDITERKQREHELQAIASLSAALRTAPTRAEMLPVIVEQLSRLLNGDSISIEIIDPITNEAVVEAAYGAWTSLTGFRQPPGTGLNAVIRETRQPYHNNNIKDDSRIGGSAYLIENIRAGAGVPLIAQDQVIGFLWMGRRKEIAESEVQLLAAVADITANALHRATLHERTRKDAADLALAYDTTLEGWVHALELRDQETEGHTRRVVQMTVELARALGIGEDELDNVRRGALLHDIGKMGIPDSVLLKPGTLNEREWEIMRRHPEYAYHLLKPIDYLHSALDIPYCHHEKWDGTGYPRGLKGEEIPLIARVFAIVDVWDALRSDRPYRKAWSTEQSLKHIQAQSGKHFDPQVVAKFLAMLAPPSGVTLMD